MASIVLRQLNDTYMDITLPHSSSGTQLQIPKFNPNAVRCSNVAQAYYIFVDGAQKDCTGSIDGIITDSAKIILSWAFYIG